MKNGPYRKYFPSGELKEEFVLLNNKRHGQYRQFYINGQLESEWFYVAGNFHGIHKHYSPRNNLLEDNIRFQCLWFNDKIHGLQVGNGK